MAGDILGEAALKALAGTALLGIAEVHAASIFEIDDTRIAPR